MNKESHADGNIGIVFEVRDEQNFISRSQFASQSQINRILLIHSADHFIHQDDSYIFYDYSRNGMSSAENYLENRIVEFYRIIFFSGIEIKKYPHQ